MRKCLRLCLALLSVAVPEVYASPWFFEATGLNATTMAATDRNTPVVVSVIDSGVAFTGGLSEAEFARFSFTEEGSPAPPATPEALHIHGTAMASVIASRRGVEGVYPHALIASRKVIPNPVRDSWIKAIENILATDYLSPGEEKIINVSGGQQGASVASAWADLLSRIGKANDRLIVAAVGNDGADIRTLSPQLRIWPAAYHPAARVNRAQDPVIRVAALAQYRRGDVPDIHRGGVTGSRYGNG